MQISLTRALAELKLIDSRLESKIQDFYPLANQQGEKKINGSIELDDFKKIESGNYQSIQDLIKRKSTIKKLLVEANAKTTVKIGEQEMTIADAIVKKDSIAIDKKLLERMKLAVKQMNAQLAHDNNSVQVKLQALLEASFGKDNVKTNPDEIKSVTEAFMNKNEWKVVEAIDIKTEITNLEKKIQDFEMEVDFALSEINSQTLIEIPDNN